MTIDKEFEALIPPLSDEEFKGLEASILEDGCRDALIVWENQGILIDGHNRYKICKKHDVEFDIIEKSFKDRYEIKQWIRRNQLSRRNLTDMMRACIMGDLYKEYKKEVGSNQYSESGVCILHTPQKTSEKLAKEFGVNESTVRRNEKLSDNIEIIEKNTSSELKNKILKEEIKATKEDVNKLAKLDVDIQKKVADKIIIENYSNLNQAIIESNKEKKVEENKEKSKEYKEDGSVQIIHNDFFNTEIEDNSIDLILTDPPYFLNDAIKQEIELEGRENMKKIVNEDWDSIEDTQIIFKAIPKMYSVLKENGSIYIFCQDNFLSHIRDSLKEHNFNVHATIVWHKTNPAPQVVKTQFCSSVEYIIYATKGKSKTFNYKEQNDMHNFIESSICMGNERYDHPTQKPLKILKHFIEISSNIDDLILDCFAGTGSVGIVCKKLKRNSILIEKEEKYINIIKARLINEK